MIEEGKRTVRARGKLCPPGGGRPVELRHKNPAPAPTHPAALHGLFVLVATTAAHDVDAEEKKKTHANNDACVARGRGETRGARGDEGVSRPARTYQSGWEGSEFRRPCPPLRCRRWSRRGTRGCSPDTSKSSWIHCGCKSPHWRRGCRGTRCRLGEKERRAGKVRVERAA